jgi:uracil-DNA glycosylase
MSNVSLTDLLAEVRSCNVCADKLAHEPRPVVSIAETASILLIGQAPGTRVHASGIPWDDPSGDRLRDWMGVDFDTFYDNSRIAIMPMGFCYPGKGKSGDLPPRPECAPLWHERLLQRLPGIKLTLLIGSYAQNYYLDKAHKTLTTRVAAWQDYLPNYLPLVHPSPRNTYWLQKNPWFLAELIPALREKINKYIKNR